MITNVKGTLTQILSIRGIVNTNYSEEFAKFLTILLKSGILTMKI